MQNGGNMQIEIKIDESCREPKVVILTDKMTDEVSGIVKKLSEDAPRMLVGFRDEMAQILEQASIIRAYAASGRVCVMTDSGEYAVRLRLYELEERLERGSFVRISNSEIINLRRLQGRTECGSAADCMLSDLWGGLGRRNDGLGERGMESSAAKRYAFAHHLNRYISDRIFYALDEA